MPTFSGHEKKPHRRFRRFAHRVRQFVNPIQEAVTTPIRQRVLREAGLTPNGTFDPLDIFIVSYPKSGNTWFRRIVAQLVFGVDAGLAPLILQGDIVPNTHEISYYRRFATPMYFKSHHLPRPDYRRVVYLLRDGRDVLVSYHHYLNARYRRQIDFDEIIEGTIFAEAGQWQEHVERWMQNPYGADMITIRYEELKLDPVPALQRFCDFAGIARDQAQIENAIEMTSFARMQSKEKAEGSPERRWDKGKLFTRRGQVGSYRDEMPEDVLAEFTARAGATLEKYGYSL